MQSDGNSFRLRPGVGASILALVALIVVTWVERVPLLRGAANIWIVSDPITHADAAVVLGGGLEDRPFVAADLYHKGLVDKVLISQVPESRAVRAGIIESHMEANRKALIKLGVPAANIMTFGSANKTTKDEAVALRQWAKTHKVTTVIIPTEIFFSRRVSWIFRKELAGTSIQVEVLAFDPPDYTRADWWVDDTGIVSFQNEVLKDIYYHLKY